MFLIALRDLQWRRRRFVIAVIGAGLVFAMTLLNTGLASGFDREAKGTVGDLGADGWLITDGASGPFLGAAPVPAAAADIAAQLPGITAAGATVFSRKSVFKDGHVKEVNVFGAPAGGPGIGTADEGRSPTAAGEIAISSLLEGFKIGDPLNLSGHPFTVVGKFSKSTALAGVPNVFLTLSDAQLVSYANQPIGAAIAVRGKLTGPPMPGFKLVGNDVAKDDLVRTLGQAQQGLALTAFLLWIVAATIIGASVYLSVLERQRDFAVFKTTGIKSIALGGSLAVQSMILSVAAAAIGSLVASLLVPNFPMRIELQSGTYMLLFFVSIVIGLLASVFGLRRVISVDPALAFGGP